MRAKLILAAFLILGLCFTRSAVAEWSEWIVDGKATLESAENVNYSPLSSGEEDDTIIYLDSNAGRNYQINKFWRLRLTADAGVEKWDEFDGLDGYYLGASAKLRKKFGVGPDKLWMTLGLSYKDESRDEDLWEVSSLNSEIRIGKSFTPRWGAWVGFHYYDNDADEELFQEQIAEFSAATHYYLTRQLLLRARVDSWEGDFHSTYALGTFGIAGRQERGNIRAIRRDPVFGGRVYSLNGDGENISADLVYLFDRQSSIKLAYSYRESEGQELEYESSKLSLSFTYSH